MMQKARECVIRRMELVDTFEIEKIEKECFSEPWSEQSIKDSAFRQNNYFIVAEKNNKIIGYTGMYFILTEGYMYNIAIKSEFRGIGIGHKLLKKLFEFCDKSSLDFLSLEVRNSNDRAIKLYEEMGFIRIGIRKGFYKNPKEDALIMTKYFK